MAMHENTEFTPQEDALVIALADVDRRTWRSFKRGEAVRPRCVARIVAALKSLGLLERVRHADAPVDAPTTEST